jgi:hypothetical protein
MLSSLVCHLWEIIQKSSSPSFVNGEGVLQAEYLLSRTNIKSSILLFGTDGGGKSLVVFLYMI